MAQAVPFGLQHVLAMFMANVTPIILVTGVAKYQGQPFSQADTALLIQAAMLAAGIGTLIQLYPVWRIGARLPIVMGLSFTFLAPAMVLAQRDYGLLMGAIIAGGCFEGVLGLTARFWRRFIPPIVPACVVIAIGISLLGTGMFSFAGGNAADAGGRPHLITATVTLLSCIVFYSYAKGIWKQLYVLGGLLVGYLAAAAISAGGFCSVINLAAMQNTIKELGVISSPTCRILCVKSSRRTLWPASL